VTVPPTSIDCCYKAPARCCETDLGSAPVEASEELLDAIVALGVKRSEIGQVE
jgi:hypothetical protein